MFCAMRLWTIVLAGGLAMLLPCCKWAYTKIGETWVNRYASGQLREGGELRGKLKEGEWEFFYEDGRKRRQGRYEQDERVGPWTAWYENGYVEWRGSFGERGGRDGLWTYYHPNGELRAVGRFGDDLEQGCWQFCAADGSMTRSGEFLDARQVGWWRYYEDGTINAQGLVYDGLRVGPWTERDAKGTTTQLDYAVPDGFELFDESWPGGALRRTGLLRADRPVGGWASFGEDAAQRGCCVFKDGTVRSLAVFASDGGLLVEGKLAGEDLDSWQLWQDGVPAPQERCALKQLPPGEGLWQQTGPAGPTTAAQVPELAAVRLQELESPVPEAALRQTPAAPVKASPVVEAPRVNRNSDQPELTEYERDQVNKYTEAYTDGTSDKNRVFGRYTVAPSRVGKPQRREDLEGEPLPIDELIATDGTVVKIADYRGKKRILIVVLRGFFGQVCPYCLAQTKALKNCRDKFDDLNLEVLLMYPGPVGDEEEFLKCYRYAFKTREAPPFRVIYDADLEIAGRLGIGGGFKVFPTTILVDEQGIIRYAYTGANKADRPAAAKILEIIEGLDRE